MNDTDNNIFSRINSQAKYIFSSVFHDEIYKEFKVDVSGYYSFIVSDNRTNMKTHNILFNETLVLYFRKNSALLNDFVVYTKTEKESILIKLKYGW